MSGVDTRRLAAIVGDGNVRTDPDVMARYLTDWTGRRTGAAAAVVRPATTGEVVEVLRWCAAQGVAVVPQGGNTGLVGGSVPEADQEVAGAETGGSVHPSAAIVLSTERMTTIGEVDTVEMCIGVQAGATVAAIESAASSAGAHFAIDLASRDSATAGGIVATNAGGVHVVRHGSTRAQVLGIEAVLADGSVIRRWDPLRKDNVGYDLPGLLTGSEGTLAVITGVLFALVEPPGVTAVSLIGVDDADQVVALVSAVRRAGLRVEAAELMTRSGVDLVVAGGARPVLSGSTEFEVLLEVSGAGAVDHHGSAHLADRLARALAECGVNDAVIDSGPARALWELRERHTETIARSSETVPVKLDVTIRRRDLGRFLADLDALAEAAPFPCRAVVFGHVADGNLHVNLLDVPLDEQPALADRVLQMVVERGGSISAEHGIGRDKRSWLTVARGDADVAAMRAIKNAWDPAGRLNPGVLFPPPVP